MCFNFVTCDIDIHSSQILFYTSKASTIGRSFGWHHFTSTKVIVMCSNRRTQMQCPRLLQSSSHGHDGGNCKPFDLIMHLSNAYTSYLRPPYKFINKVFIYERIMQLSPTFEFKTIIKLMYAKNEIINNAINENWMRLLQLVLKQTMSRCAIGLISW